MLFSRDGSFHGYCDYCGEWGHKRYQCNAQRVHISTDEFEPAEDGYAYDPSSNYYSSNSYEDNNEQVEEEQQGVHNVMISCSSLRRWFIVKKFLEPWKTQGLFLEISKII